MTDYVRLGTLDFLLTKPFDAQLLVSLRQVRVNNLLDPVLGLGLTTVGVVLSGRGPSLPGLAAFLAFFTTYPAATLLGRLDPYLLVIAPAVAAGAVVVATLAWRRALRSYTGASA